MNSVLLRLVLASITLLLLTGCTPKAHVLVDGGASNDRSSGHIMFSQPF